MSSTFVLALIHCNGSIPTQVAWPAMKQKTKKSQIPCTLSSNYIVLKNYQFQQAKPATDHLVQLRYLGK